MKTSLNIGTNGYIVKANNGKIIGICLMKIKFMLNE